jgi:isoleucyl-tRNA synthetase
VMPWCVRCGTSVSQHEMLDAYAELTHRSVVVAMPIVEDSSGGAAGRSPHTPRREHAALLAWTTTPWTLPANVALAVHPDLEYEGVAVGDRLYYVAATARARFPQLRDVRERVRGADLVGLRYRGPFDGLPAQQGVEHRVVGWSEVAADEGTGVVHIAPGCGQEDFELARRHGLATIAPVGEDGRYGPDFGPLAGRDSLEATSDIVAHLRAAGTLVHEAPYRHRYPTCWRCGHELLFRLVDEWFIRADELRPLARAANATVTWHPDHMRLRMDDWLQNMGDWCISRKRYWGLPLPFYPCATCGRLTVAGSLAELRALAVDPSLVDALPELHRPWIDDVVIGCPGCGSGVRRVPEVGDCWLDAGVVPFSTLRYLEDRAFWAEWFPADFVVEMAAQVRGWFYAMLFMAVTLEGRAPYRTVMAHDRVLGEDGREMHKSWGNAVWFDEAVDRMGPDVIRYLFASQPVTEPIRFGYAAGRDVTRRFLTLWNVYTLFVTYANLDRPPLAADAAAPVAVAGLEAWVLARLQTVVREVRAALDRYQLRRAVQAVETFVQEDLSNWYVRRRRRWFWKGEMTEDKVVAYRTLHHVLVRVCQLLAPVMPFVAEHLYRALVAGLGDGVDRVTHGSSDAADEATAHSHHVEHSGQAQHAGLLEHAQSTGTGETPQPGTSARVPASVHLTSFPVPDPRLEDATLEAGVAFVRRVLSVGLAARNAAGVKVRQPLARAAVVGPPDLLPWLQTFEADVREELNVDALELRASDGEPAENATEPATGAADQSVGADQSDRRSAGPAIRSLDLDSPSIARDGDVTVVLDTHLTSALRRQGAARQLVHQVQMLRKNAGLEVADRIRLFVAADADLRAALEEHASYVCTETLAVDLTLGPLPAGVVPRDVKLGGAVATVGVVRAAGQPDERPAIGS